MAISINTRQAYSEVDEFLNIISAENRNKVPLYLIQFFNNEKDENYIKEISPEVPIKNQGLKEETLAIIAWLNLEYWCQDENEKKRLKEIYEKNEARFRETVQVSFSPDEVFKQKEKVKENVAIIKKEESKIKRIINKIKSIFWG